MLMATLLLSSSLASSPNWQLLVKDSQNHELLAMSCDDLADDHCRFVFGLHGAALEILATDKDDSVELRVTEWPAAPVTTDSKVLTHATTTQREDQRWSIQLDTVTVNLRRN